MLVSLLANIPHSRINVQLVISTDCYYLASACWILKQPDAVSRSQVGPPCSLRLRRAAAQLLLYPLDRRIYFFFSSACWLLASYRVSKLFICFGI